MLAPGCKDKKSDLPVIGVANYGAHPVLDTIMAAFKRRLKEKGYEDGKQIKLLIKSVEGEVTKAPAMAQALASSPAKVIVSLTTPVSQAVYAEVKGKKPLVFCGVTDPVGAGLVKSWENEPGSGVTGTSDRWPYAEQLDLIKKILPKAAKVGFPFNSGEANSQYALREVRRLAGERKLVIMEAPVTSTAEIPTAIRSLIGRGVDAIYVSSDNTLMSGFNAVLQAAHERHVPVFVGESANVEKGGLATYSVDYERLGEVTADIVIKVLEGAEPGTIPVATFSGEELHINLDAAKRMGVTVPPDLIEKATRVYK